MMFNYYWKKPKRWEKKYSDFRENKQKILDVVSYSMFAFDRVYISWSCSLVIGRLWASSSSCYKLFKIRNMYQVALLLVFNYVCLQFIKMVSWKYIRLVRRLNGMKWFGKIGCSNNSKCKNIGIWKNGE